MTADTDALPPHLTVTKTDRGFSHLPTIPSVYGGHVEVSESSGAENQYLWLRSTAPVNLNEPSGPTREAPIHLVVEDALRLADQLVHSVAEHYQYRGNVLRGQLQPLAAEVSEKIGEMLAALIEADEEDDDE